MHHTWPRDVFGHALLAHVSIAEESARGTEEAVIVQGLYDGNSFPVGRVVDSGRDERESIVDVNDVGFFPAHQVAKLLMDLLIEDGIAEQDQGIHAGHLIVAGLVQNHVMAMRAQQIGLLGEDLILPSWQLVLIVHGENLHNAPCLPRTARFTICFQTLWVSKRSTARWKSGR